MTAPVSAPTWREWGIYAPLDATYRVRFQAAVADVVEGLRRWRLWSYLALDDIRNSYRRTVVGPWWITLQTVIHITFLALLFSAVFHRSLREFMPYVGTGYIVFGFLRGMTSFSADVFVARRSIVVSHRQPLSVLVLHGIAVEILQFLHNIVIVVVFAAFGTLTLNLRSLLILPATVLMVVNGALLGLWLGPVVARYRDASPVVGSIVQLLSFFTPIFWTVDSVRGQHRAFLLDWNPFYFFLETFRAPLLGTRVAFAFGGVLIITLANLLAALVVFVNTRSRVPYWVS